MIKTLEDAVKELRGAITSASTEADAKDLHSVIGMLRDLSIAKVRCLATHEQNAANLKRAVDVISEARSALNAVLEQ